MAEVFSCISLTHYCEPLSKRSGARVQPQKAPHIFDFQEGPSLANQANTIAFKKFSILKISYLQVSEPLLQSVAKRGAAHNREWCFNTKNNPKQTNNANCIKTTILNLIFRVGCLNYKQQMTALSSVFWTPARQGVDKLNVCLQASVCFWLAVRDNLSSIHFGMALQSLITTLCADGCQGPNLSRQLDP